MRFAIILITLACIIGIDSTLKLSQAVQLRDGKVYFVQVPRLVKATTTFDDVNIWGATYYFTVQVPSDAGEPLQKITINQHSGLDNINFDLKDSFAISGTTKSEKEKLPLQITEKRREKTVSLTFNPPVEPGKTINIALKPIRNPSVEGVYLFGVTAFPAGEKSHGQFLGYGRLHFYRNNSSLFSPFGW
ncbi:DUF2808 domain-containing protein [Rivularia sp. UHCC 0363]|uniref:DUF2808 domain-containing protein n=1 Tax=Rivularia sp. UHCC 0363 TaxID=3110244 RepID=UPI002B1FBE2B|nr:DUF2808 domain-containing protein [Rivularia sp. UHCC 0363]MEA5596570.1 DUF2808 domain-containing protein [Rivularia sp. UHCC 0363]